MRSVMKHHYARLLGILIISLLMLTACTAKSTPETTPGSSYIGTATSTPTLTTAPAGTTAASVQAYATPTVESMLVSLDNNDYAGFSKDLDQTAKSAITSNVFSQLYDQIKATIGSYESVVFFGSSTKEADTTVSYIAHYTNEPAGVTVTVVFQTVNSTRYVHGFTLDSPELRGQSIDVSKIRSYADPATENILVSLNNDDYSTFSKDLNQQMKTVASQTSFGQIYNMIKTKAGKYKSMQFESVSEQNNVVTVKYLTQYTEEPSGVWVTIQFDSSQEVAGLFFNSPRINGQ